MPSPSEIWRAIPGYVGYEVSDQGRLRSLDRIIDCAGDRNREAYRRRFPGRVLKPALDASGYPSVGHVGRIHMLVMLAFVGRCPDGMEICHGNGDKTDCRLVNLRYGTSAENQADKLLHGRDNRGERHGMAKLTVGDVILIRDMREATNREMADFFHVSPSCIRMIRAGKRWNWLRVRDALS